MRKGECRAWCGVALIVTLAMAWILFCGWAIYELVEWVTSK
jgi:hypothetical protein